MRIKTILRIDSSSYEVAVSELGKRLAQFKEWSIDVMTHAVSSHQSYPLRHFLTVVVTHEEAIERAEEKPK